MGENVFYLLLYACYFGRVFTRIINTSINILSLDVINARSKTGKECRPIGADTKYVRPIFDSENNR